MSVAQCIDHLNANRMKTQGLSKIEGSPVEIALLLYVVADVVVIVAAAATLQQ